MTSDSLDLRLAPMAGVTNAPVPARRARVRGGAPHQRGDRRPRARRRQRPHARAGPLSPRRTPHRLPAPRERPGGPGRGRAPPRGRRRRRHRPQHGLPRGKDRDQGPWSRPHARSPGRRRRLPHHAQGHPRPLHHQDPRGLGRSPPQRRGDRPPRRGGGRRRHHRPSAHALPAVHRARALGDHRRRGQRGAPPGHRQRRRAQPRRRRGHGRDHGLRRRDDRPRRPGRALDLLGRRGAARGAGADRSPALRR